MSAEEIHEDIDNTLGDDCHFYWTEQNWTAEFKRWRTVIEDEPSSGRPKEANTDI